MAVFEYRGILSTSGKQVHGVRDADNAKSLRALPETIDGVPPLPVPQTCPSTLDDLLAEG